VVALLLPLSWLFLFSFPAFSGTGMFHCSKFLLVSVSDYLDDSSLHGGDATEKTGKVSIHRDATYAAVTDFVYLGPIL
jgi:hypothetical protein